MSFEVIDPNETEGPINEVPLVWDDENPHELMSDWSEELCWCEPVIDGKYVRHRSVFDAIDLT